MTRGACALAIAAGVDIHGSAQSEVMGLIRDEALSRSPVQADCATLTDQFGPRLIGTPAYKQAADRARAANTDPRLPRPESATSGR